MNRQFRVSRRGLVVALGLAQVPFAYAQDMSTQARVALEEIIVTAERRETQLQDTPISIASLTSEQIERTGSQQLEDLQAFVPNMVINYDPFFGRANPQFNIRGVGASTQTSGVVTERPVGLYIDGLYYARVQGSLLSTIDAGQIDVLRGPQGTLFGRNTTGGAIVYTTKKPTEDFEGNIRVKAGKFDQREVQGMVNLPLGENVFLRALAAQVEQDGYVQRAYEDLGNVDDEVYRAQLRILPADNLTIDLSGSYSETRSNGSPLVINEYNLNGAPNNAGHFGAVSLLLEDQGEPAFTSNDPRLVSRDQAPEFCILDDTNPLTFGEECETNLDGELTVLSANVKWDISDTVSLTSITGRLSGEQSSATDWANTGASTRLFDIDFETTSQEFQLNWDTDALKFVAGAIYFNEEAVEDEITEDIAITGAPSIRLTAEQIRAGESVLRRDEVYEADTTSYGIYIQATWSATDRLNLTGGLRYSKDEKDVTIVYSPTEDDPRDETGSGSETWDDVDWRAAVDYRVTDDVMVYASATNAYKAGIADDSALENSANTENLIPFIPPEHATGYEVGLRSEWFDRRFRYNMSVFRTDYTNRQSARLIDDPAGGGGLILETVNLGDVRYQGFEIDTALALPYNVTLNGSFGLVDYEVSDDPDGVLGNIPEESWTAGIAWAPPVSFGQLDVSANYGHSSHTWAFSGNTDLSPARIPVQARNPGYGVLSGRISYTPDSQGWSVALYGTNLLDEDYTGSSVGHHFHLGRGGRNLRGGYLGRPRSFGVEAQLNF